MRNSFRLFPHLPRAAHVGRALSVPISARNAKIARRLSTMRTTGGKIHCDRQFCAASRTWSFYDVTRLLGQPLRLVILRRLSEYPWDFYVVTLARVQPAGKRGWKSPRLAFSSSRDRRLSPCFRSTHRTRFISFHDRCTMLTSRRLRSSRDKRTATSLNSVWFCRC